MAAKDRCVTQGCFVSHAPLAGVECAPDMLLKRNPKRDLARTARLIVFHEDALFFDLPVNLGCCLRRFDYAHLRPRSEGLGEVLALPEFAKPPRLRPRPDLQVEVRIACIAVACGRPACVGCLVERTLGERHFKRCHVGLLCNQLCNCMASNGGSVQPKMLILLCKTSVSDGQQVGMG